MEVDHIFICVKPGAPEAEALREFGLKEGSSNRHPGQGTVNRKFFFHNAFVELLWLDDPTEAQSEVTQRTMLYERLASAGKETSPFGICFRPEGSGEKEVLFPSWSYTPSYLPENLKIEIGKAPVSEPMWFFLSFGPRPDIAPKDKQHPIKHEKSLLELTSLRITIQEARDLSAPACWAANTHGVEIVDGDNHLLEIGFDHVNEGRSYDFRPVLPLVFKW